MKKKKLIVLFVYIILVLSAVKVLAKDIIDMQKINVNVVKPISKFEIEYEMPSGESGTITSNSKIYYSDEYEFDQNANLIEVEYGTKIKIKDLSECGSGEKIVNYDFQMYTPSYDDLINTKNKNNFEKEYVLNESGTYSFYLSVMDNYKNVGGYDNWSINGNHRWLSENPNNKNQLFYWYFAQLNIIVLDENKEIDEPIILDEPAIPDEPINPYVPIVDEDNHNPEVEILLPDHFYPEETNYINSVCWFYYDEDDDDMIESGYELYKINGREKILIDCKDGLTKRSQCEINISGKMHDKFILDVWVVDEEDNYGYASEKLEIEEFFPKVIMNHNDRAYLNDIVDVEYMINDELSKLLILNFDKYEIYKGNIIICEGKGKLEHILIDDNYEESNNYIIKQYVSNSYGTVKTLEGNIFIVPIEKPIVTLDNITLYYGDEKSMNTQIVQAQSRLKGKLKNYEYDFKDDDMHYEIYLNDKMIFSAKGKIENFKATSEMNIDEPSKETIYTVYQYATNGANKTGCGKSNVVVKTPEDDFVTIDILERDNDPLTIKNEIYPNENLNIETKYYSKSRIIKQYTNIVDEGGNVVKHIDGLINGLYKMDLKEGMYKIVATIENGCGKLNASVNFEVKKIEKPVIEISNVNERYFKTDMFNAEIVIKDINRSEEHPNGFELDKYYSINENVNDGTLDKVSLNALKNKETYSLVQSAVNIEHENVRNDKEVTFYLENLLPLVISDNENKYNYNETIEFDITSNDLDGYITEFNIECNEDINVIDYKNEEWIKHIKIQKPINKIITLNVSCTDDSNDTSYKQINIEVVDDSLPYIKLITKEKDRRKINRYIQIEYGNINGGNVELLINGDVINFVNDLYEDEKVKMVKESENIAGLDFKIANNYEISARTNNQIRNLNLSIMDDYAPELQISSVKEIYRNPDTKKATITVDEKYITDDEIEYIKLYDLDKEYDSNVIELDYNEVGIKKIIGLIKETHSYLPDINHPLYNDLILKMKSNYSNEIEVEIINMKPEIFYNSKTNKYNIKIIE